MLRFVMSVVMLRPTGSMANCEVRASLYTTYK